MRLSDIQEGSPVIYIPKYLLIGPKEEMVKHENLGIVTSKNDKFVFVRYRGQENSVATRAEDLYTLKYRTDLLEILYAN